MEPTENNVRFWEYQRKHRTKQATVNNKDYIPVEINKSFHEQHVNIGEQQREQQRTTVSAFLNNNEGIFEQQRKHL